MDGVPLFLETPIYTYKYEYTLQSDSTFFWLPQFTHIILGLFGLERRETQRQVFQSRRSRDPFWKKMDSLKARPRTVDHQQEPPIEQWPKPWLLAAYGGLYSQLYRDYNKPWNKDPINQPGFHGMSFQGLVHFARLRCVQNKSPCYISLHYLEPQTTIYK